MHEMFLRGQSGHLSSQHKQRWPVCLLCGQCSAVIIMSLRISGVGTVGVSFSTQLMSPHFSREAELVTLITRAFSTLL